MIVKKTRFTVIFLIILSVILSACGSANNVEQDAEIGNENSEEIELNIISWRVEDRPIFDEIHSLFEEEYPNVKINFDTVPTSSYEQLQNTRMALNDVDIVAGKYKEDVMDPTRNNMWLDLTGQKVLEGYNTEALEIVKYDGKQLLLPWNSVSFVTFYNEEIFKDLGISIPETWEEFIAACETIRAAGIDPIIFGGKDQWPVNMILISLEQSLVRGPSPNFYDNMRSEETKFDDDEWMEVFKRLEMMSNYFEDSYLGVDYSQAPGIFAQGKAAMMIDGSWSLAQVLDANPEFEVGVFNLPGSDNEEWNKNISVKISDGWMINKNSDNQEAALKYLEFFSRHDIYQKYIDFVKNFPVVDGIELNNDLANKVLDLINNNNQISNWEEMRVSGANIIPELHAIEMLAGQKSPEEATYDMQQQFIESKSNWSD